MRIKAKMILLISGVVALTVFPLAYVVMQSSKAVIEKKTFDLCANISETISKSATEELLLNTTYDATRTAVMGLLDQKTKVSKIEGLLTSRVINVDWQYVADMRDDKDIIGKNAKDSDQEYISGLTKMEQSEPKTSPGELKILKYTYPIFIKYKKTNLRVGAAVFEFDKDQVYAPMENIQQTIIYVAAGIFILMIIVAVFSGIYISRPILSLSEGARIIGGGNLDHRIEKMTSDEIGELTESFNDMTEKIQDFTHNLEEKVKERTAQLAAAKKEVDDIMHNITQGILTINKKGKINAEYSTQVVDIFESKNIANKNFSNLFSDKKIQDTLNNYIKELFTNTWMSETMLKQVNPLVDYHFSFPVQKKVKKVKILDFSFSRIFAGKGKTNDKDPEKIMVNILDKTADYQLQRELEEKAKREAAKVEKLYQIMQLEPRVFTDFIKEAVNSLDAVAGKLKELGKSAEKNILILDVCFREVHTLKGNARALNLDSISQASHRLEDIFSEMKEQPSKIDTDEKGSIEKVVSELKEEVKDGGNIFEKILNMQDALKVQDKDLMAELHTTMKNVVKRETEKSDVKIEMAFENKLKKTPPGHLIIKIKNILIQLVGNSIGHGIESKKVRKSVGKSEVGKIALKFSQSAQHLLIICEDDGAGMDIQKIKNKALEKKIITKEKLASLSNKQIYSLIFTAGFSTAKKVTELFGRGFGMSIVKENVQTLNAKISIETQIGKFTRFIVKIPYSEGA
jgi:sensor histidine kinase regulating citrate/malate metabolism